MQNICPKCHINPRAHSFKILKQFDSENPSNKTIFYTCPADADEYNDSNGILAHYENMLKANGNKDWVWIFNCDRMALKHSMELNTVHGIAKIISEKYMHNIKQIYVINANYILTIILNFIWPFLNDKLKDLIIIDDDLPFEVNFDN